jgi:WD40 repeat protein
MQVLYHSGCLILDDITGLKFYGQSKNLLSVSWDCSMKFWDIENKKCLHELEGAHDGKSQIFSYMIDGIRALGITSDEKTFVTGASDCLIKLWDVSQRICIHTIREAHIGSVDIFP